MFASFTEMASVEDVLAARYVQALVSYFLSTAGPGGRQTVTECTDTTERSLLRRQ
jgi:acetaldehyde dehydrogenase (acetylating)